MANDLVVREDERFAAQLANFAAKLPHHATALNISTEQITQAKQDAVFMEWALKSCKQFQTHSLNWTSYKDYLRKPNTTAPLGNAPAAPNLEAMPLLVDADIEGRFRKLANHCKSQKSYIEAIGLDLGIVAPKKANKDYSTVQPKFIIELSAGHPLLKGKKDSFDGIEVYVNTHDGNGFVFLDFSTTANYLDKRSKLPAYGDVALWKYRCIYRNKNEQVGKWSDEVEILVKGV